MVGQISHDLRTPLNSMTLLLNTVVQRGLTDAKVIIEEYIKPTLVNCNLLMSLICDVLSYSSESLGKKHKDPISIEPTDLRKTLQDFFYVFVMRSEYRKLEFKYEIDDNIPKVFNTDPRRVIQILNNIISNSMKFTFEGFVKVEVKSI